MLDLKEGFRKLAHGISDAAGSVWAFTTACMIVIIWGATGPLFGFSDTWQLVINTGTTIITFLMVFLIQNTQNRESKAVHLKLDELIKSIEKADDAMLNLENLSDEDLTKLHEQFEKLGKWKTAEKDGMRPS